MLPLPSDIVYSTFFNCYHYHLILYTLLSLEGYKEEGYKEEGYKEEGYKEERYKEI